MPRKIKVIPDIEFLIRSRMEECEECEDVEFGYVQWHAPEEAGGCNWDVPFLSGHHISVNQCRTAILEHVRRLQAEFNIPDPE